MKVLRWSLFTSVYGVDETEGWWVGFGFSGFSSHSRPCHILFFIVIGIIIKSNNNIFHQTLTATCKLWDCWDHMWKTDFHYHEVIYAFYLELFNLLLIFTYSPLVHLDCFPHHSRHLIDLVDMRLHFLWKNKTWNKYIRVWMLRVNYVKTFLIRQWKNTLKFCNQKNNNN